MKRFLILSSLLGVIGVGIVCFFGYKFFSYSYFAAEPSSQAPREDIFSPFIESSPASNPKSPNLAQLFAVPYDFNSTEISQEKLLSFIHQEQVGFVVLFGSQISTTEAKKTIQSIQGTSYPDNPPLIVVDHEGGSVQRLSGPGFTLLPSWQELCQRSSVQRQRVLATSASELQAVGVNIVFAPVVDVAKNTSPQGNRICSPDPNLVTAAAFDFIQTFHQHQMQTVLKHFPGIGSTTTDTHFQPTSVTTTPQDTQPFTSLLSRYPQEGVMSAHVSLATQNTGLPCSLSAQCLDTLYALSPKVIIYSDGLEMVSARYNPQEPETLKPIADVAVEAILAGNTVLVFGRNITAEELGQILQRFQTEYTASDRFREKVDRAVQRIHRLQDETFSDLEPGN